MQKNNNKESFTYTYSAKQREEVKAIRSKYFPPEEDKMEQLRRLDQRATTKGTAVSIALGITGALLLGTGMSCVFVWSDYLVLGSIVGVIGMAAIALAFPVFEVITKKQRAKLAPTIRQITDDLMKQE